MRVCVSGPGSDALVLRSSAPDAYSVVEEAQDRVCQEPFSRSVAARSRPSFNLGVVSSTKCCVRTVSGLQNNTKMPAQ